jgi:hypothetical protein
LVYGIDAEKCTEKHLFNSNGKRFKNRPFKREGKTGLYTFTETPIDANRNLFFFCFRY